MIIELPENFIQKKDYSEKDFRVDIAVTLYQQQVISLARAARWCSMTRLAFQKLLSKRNVSINYTSDDLAKDIQSLIYIGLAI